jgi:hypothetical protein
MTKKQQALLDAIPVKKHDPDGITIKTIMDVKGVGRSGAAEIFRAKLVSGEAVRCWVKQGAKMVPGIKLKGK